VPFFEGHFAASMKINEIFILVIFHSSEDAMSASPVKILVDVIARDLR